MAQPSHAATFRIVPPELREGELLVLRGEGWPDCELTIRTGGRDLVLQAIALGVPVGAGLRPDPHGEFVAYVSTRGWKSGRHELQARSRHRRVETAKASVVIAPRLVARAIERDDAHEAERQDEGEQEPADAAYERQKFLFDRSFDRLHHIPPGLALQQIADVRDARKRQRRTPVPGTVTPLSAIVPGACNWTLVGAGGAVDAPFVGISGRVNAIAVDPDPSAPNTVYLGASGGGIWKTTDGGTTWLPTADYQGSLRIACLAIDPHDHLNIYAGTGDGGYPGIGLLHSVNGGDTWTEEAADTLGGSIVKKIIFDPADTTSQHLFAATTHGVYETTNASVWTQLRAGMADDVVLVPGTGGAITLVTAFRGEGLMRATKSGGTWSSWTLSSDAALPATYGRIVLGQCAGTPSTICAAIAETTRDGIQGIFRTIDGGGSWQRVDVRLDSHYYTYETGGAGHSHSLTVPTADMIAPPAARTYTTASGGSPAHTHSLNLTAAHVQAIAAGGQVSVTTAADSTGHTHTYAIYAVSQANYNLYVRVHPVNPNVIFLGVTFLWKTSSGGGVFAKISGSMHVDQHSFAFDPVDPTNRLWAGNDGGIYRSTDGGSTWESRNNGLATLEYYSVAVHPQWENVLIAGSQDNGVHRYSGNPVCREVFGWDIMRTAIDPTEPTRMYIERQYQNGVMRSDTGGEPGSWTNTTAIPSGSPQFGNPFVLDPTTPAACFFGNTQLWRSPMYGNSWVSVTAAFSSNISTIAVHPTDSNIVYFATGEQVYRAQRTGATWSGADIALTPLGGPVVSGVTLLVSDLAIETSGTVWAVTASIISGGLAHVFRLEGSDWVPRAAGLPVTIGINAIVIDRTAESRLFCGGAIGVYRSDDSGASWNAWDAGLPNAPISDLVIGPGRMVRAATYGRSVWEREIDPLPLCPAVDLYIRDNILDSGRQLPSPENVAHPFDPSRRVWHWQSPDVKVDAEEGTPAAFQTPAALGDAIGFASLTHRNPRRGRTNRFYAQVHNRGYDVAHNVRVRAFFADAHAGLPPLPADFWTMGRPFSGTPSGSDWTPIGASASFGRVNPGQPAVAEWDWFVSSSANEHSCLLVVVTSDEIALAGSGVTDADALVRNFKLVALKNLHVINFGATAVVTPDDAAAIELPSVTREMLVAIEVHWGNLPAGARLVLAFEQRGRGRLPVLAPAEALKREGVSVVRAENAWFVRTRETRCGDERRFDLDRVLVLTRIRDVTTISDVVLSPRHSLAVQVRLLLPDGTQPKAPLWFDVLQRAGNRVVGGSTYLVCDSRAAIEE